MTYSTPQLKRLCSLADLTLGVSFNGPADTKGDNTPGRQTRPN